MEGPDLDSPKNLVGASRPTRRKGWATTLALTAALSVIVPARSGEAADTPRTVTLIAEADTTLDAAQPARNLGADASLRVDASPRRTALVRFGAVPGSAVTRATLRLHVSSVPSASSPTGGAVGLVGNSWEESAVAWSDQPGASGSFVSGGVATPRSWVVFEVTAALRGDQPVSFAVSSFDKDGVVYDSRESAHPPELRLELSAAPQARAASPDAPVVIAAVGDLVCPPKAKTTATSCRHREISNRLVDDRAVQAVLALGDLQYDAGELAGFTTSYEASFGRLKAKTHPAVGNHEYGTPAAAGYFAYWGAQAGAAGEGYYSFDVGRSWHVVALNSNCKAVGGCKAGSAQERWLRADLARNQRPCTIAYWHHPRFSSGGVHGGEPGVAPLWAAMADFGAEAVLSGHEHQYERFAAQDVEGRADPLGIVQFVVGTGGRSIYGFDSAKPNSAARIGEFGYLRLTLADGSYSWGFVTEAGVVQDQGSAECH